tara:strand:- start:592 stop:1497 length:906 start_codon:yes stop_codon:yes gene_type:complete
MKKTKLSHSRIVDFNKCKRLFKYRNIENIYPKKTKDFLQFGSVFHDSLRQMYEGVSLAKIQDANIDIFNEFLHSTVDQKQVDEIESSAVVLNAALEVWHTKFYRKDKEKFEIVEMEKKHENLPIRNPKTNRKTQFVFSFIPDMVVRFEGGLWLVEYKTATQTGNSFFHKLEMDFQVSAYVGYLQQIYKEPIQGVIYRVLKKPSIRLKKNETRHLFYKRLIELYKEKQSEYLIEYIFRRNQAEIDAYKMDLFKTSKLIKQAIKDDCFPRNSHACQLFGKCSYWDLCMGVENSEMLFEKIIKE